MTAPKDHKPLPFSLRTKKSAEARTPQDQGISDLVRAATGELLTSADPIEELLRAMIAAQAQIICDETLSQLATTRNIFLATRIDELLRAIPDGKLPPEAMERASEFEAFVDTLSKMKASTARTGEEEHILELLLGVDRQDKTALLRAVQNEMAAAYAETMILDRVGAELRDFVERLAADVAIEATAATEKHMRAIFKMAPQSERRLKAFRRWAELNQQASRRKGFSSTVLTKRPGRRSKNGVSEDEIALSRDVRADFDSRQLSRVKRGLRTNAEVAIAEIAEARSMSYSTVEHIIYPRRNAPRRGIGPKPARRKS